MLQSSFTFVTSQMILIELKLKLQKDLYLKVNLKLELLNLKPLFFKPFRKSFAKNFKW